MGSPDLAALRLLRQARDRIDREYADEIPIAKLAAAAGYSREHFIRAFRAAYGQTPGRYRTQRRVERAADLLRSANLTVTEICCLVGFTSLGSFSARFTEVTGLSPTAYRRAAAERGGPAPIHGCFALMWHAGLPGAGSRPQPVTSGEAAAKPVRLPSPHGNQPGKGQGFLYQRPGLHRQGRLHHVPGHHPAVRDERPVITGVSIVSVWVLDQDAAKEFYTSKLGCTVTTDIELAGGMRWLTVRPPGSTNQDLLLMDPARSMLDADTAKQLRALIAKGALSPGVLATDDCRGDYQTLTERGVEFTQPPATRPYGIEAVLRDDSGNWYSFTQRTY